VELPHVEVAAVEDCLILMWTWTERGFRMRGGSSLDVDIVVYELAEPLVELVWAAVDGWPEDLIAGLLMVLVVLALVVGFVAYAAVGSLDLLLRVSRIRPRRRTLRVSSRWGIELDGKALRWHEELTGGSAAIRGVEHRGDHLRLLTDDEPVIIRPRGQYGPRAMDYLAEHVQRACDVLERAGEQTARSDRAAKAALADLVQRAPGDG